MRVHRDDFRRHGHPQVGGQTEATIRQQMNILRHVGIARFEREIGSQHYACAQTWLHTLISLALNGESGIMHACVHAENVAESHVVLDVKSRFVSIHIRRTHDGVNHGLLPFFYLHRLHLGAENVVGVVAAKADFMVGQGRVGKINLGRKVINARLVGHVELVFR